MKVLFEQFKAEMPKQELLFESALESVLGGMSCDEIRKSFSGIVERIHDHIYSDYKKAESLVGHKVIFCSADTPSFESLDAFFLSLSQSRKSRAGQAFEWILEELLSRRLGYPMDGQVSVEGAKPDFVLPSAEYYRRNAIDCMLLTAKRTLRERWRQVVTETDKTYSYFLATLDPKISSSQLEQASKHKVFIVTSEGNISNNSHYEESGNVISFEDFITKHLDPACKRWSECD